MLAVMLAQSLGEKEVAESGVWAFLGKFAVSLPQPMACELHPQSKDRALRMKGKQSCTFLWQLQHNVGLK